MARTAPDQKSWWRPWGASVRPDDLVEQVGRFGGRLLVKDSHGAALVLFPDRWSLEHAEKDERLRWLEAAA
jgi:hypothetical protein